MRLCFSIATAACLAIAPLAVAHHTSTPVIFTVAGTGESGYLNGSAPTQGRLNGPAGLAVDPVRGYWVADTINQRVRKVGAMFRGGAGNGRSGDAGDGGRADDAELQDPTALEFHPRGLLIADTANNRIRQIGPSGTISTFAGTSEQGFAGDGGPATAARLNGPEGLEVAADGTVLVSDSGNNRIRAIAPDGTIWTIAGGDAGFAGDRGPAEAALLRGPRGLALAGDGALLVADTGNHRLRRIGPDGVITTVAGNGGASSVGDGGPAAAAGLNRPSDVATASDGAVYVVETGGNRVRLIAPDGTISRFAGAGGPRYRGDGGAPAKALLNAPRAVEVLPRSGGVLIADTDNNVIRHVTVPGSSPLMAIAPTKLSIRARLRSKRLAPMAIQFQLSGPAQVVVAIHERRGPRVARFVRSGRAGHNRVAVPHRFRVGPRRLTKGRYVIRLAAVSRSTGRAFRSLELTVR